LFKRFYKRDVVEAIKTMYEIRNNEYKHLKYNPYKTICTYALTEGLTPDGYSYTEVCNAYVKEHGRVKKIFFDLIPTKENCVRYGLGEKVAYNKMWHYSISKGSSTGTPELPF
jgi:hypothetical protein